MTSARKPSSRVSNNEVHKCTVYIPNPESCCARSESSDSMGNSTSIIRGPCSKYEGYDPASHC